MTNTKSLRLGTSKSLEALWYALKRGQEFRPLPKQISKTWKYRKEKVKNLRAIKRPEKERIAHGELT